MSSVSASRTLALAFAAAFAGSLLLAEDDVNYDESRVPEFTLPDPLTLGNGDRVMEPAAWLNVRRPEILRLFETHVYGRPAERPLRLAFRETSRDLRALGGRATRKQVAVDLEGNGRRLTFQILLYVPHRGSGPHPAFVGLNFGGNHTIHPDPGIDLPEVWVRTGEGREKAPRPALPADRGKAASRWPVERIIERGYSLVTVYKDQIDPDYHDGFRNGVHRLYYARGQTQPAPDEWGTISAWAWGLSRVMDYIESDADVDESRVALLGHSRLGKTALWAGARDQRFAIVISNNSGCGGAALSRRRFGEKVQRINRAFPHWFCANFKKYDDNEAALPVDQHELIALIAPRPVYVASAVEDRWADPRGEFLSLKYATPVYELLGRGGLGIDDPPPVDQPAAHDVGYHVRSGGHDVTRFDWKQYLDFADRHLGK